MRWPTTAESCSLLSLSRRYLRSFRTTLHPLLAIFLPLLYLITVDHLIKALAPFLAFSSVTFYPVLLAVAVEETAVGNFLFRERSGAGARLRELLLVLASSLVLALAIYRVPFWKAGAMARVDLYYAVGLALLQWLFSQLIHGGLRQREVLLEGLKARRSEGLVHSLREASLQAGVSVRELRSIKRLVLFFQISLFILLLVAAVNATPLSTAVFWLTAAHAFAGFLTIGITHLFIENQLLLGSGVVVPGRLEARRMRFILALLGGCAVIVLVVARDASLLPLERLLAFLDRLIAWVAGLFRLKADPRMAETVGRMLAQRERYYHSLLHMQSAPPGVLTLLLLEGLRRLIRTLAAVGVFLFLVYPLLSAEVQERMRGWRPWRLIRRKLAALALALVRFFRWLGRWWRSSPSSRRTVGARVRKLPREVSLPGRLGVRKRIQAGRVLRAFLRLTLWSERRGVPCGRAETPQEFGRRLSASLALPGRELSLVLEVLEEALFSARLLPHSRLARYLAAVRTLTRER